MCVYTYFGVIKNHVCPYKVYTNKHGNVQVYMCTYIKYASIYVDVYTYVLYTVFIFISYDYIYIHGYLDFLPQACSGIAINNTAQMHCLYSQLIARRSQYMSMGENYSSINIQWEPASLHVQLYLYFWLIIFSCLAIYIYILIYRFRYIHTYIHTSIHAYIHT